MATMMVPVFPTVAAVSCDFGQTSYPVERIDGVWNGFAVPVFSELTLGRILNDLEKSGQGFHVVVIDDAVEIHNDDWDLPDTLRRSDSGEWVWDCGWCWEPADED